MAEGSPLSPGGRHVAGAACMVAGTVFFLAAFDIGPLHQHDIHGPPELAAVMGGIIALAGIAIINGNRGREHPLSYLLAFMILTGFAAVGNWIAFGAGTRQFSGGIEGVISFGVITGEMIGRIVFGAGAMILNGILIWMFARGLKKAVGAGPLVNGMEQVAQGILLLCLSPILLPLLLLILVNILFSACGEFLTTGKWPRNEAFIARMKTKRGNPS